MTAAIIGCVFVVGVVDLTEGSLRTLSTTRTPDCREREHESRVATSIAVAVSAVVVAGIIVGAAGSLHADGTITGRGRFERVRGRPALGHVELYESNLFLSPDGGGARGPSFRLGAPPGEAPRGDGFFSLTVPAGTYSLLVAQPLFFIRPRVIGGIEVRDGMLTTRNVELPIDYSTAFTDDWTTFEDTWIQTFVATGTAITGVSWKLAGTNADRVECTVLADDGNADPSLWPLASARARKSDSVAALADNWVRWRSDEVPTVAGRRYAVRLRGVSGGDRRFAVFRRAKDANSYANGSAFRANNATPRGYDLHITVFSDNDGTAILLAKTTEGLGDLRDGNYGGRWGQTFRATQGNALAAVDVWAAGAERNWDLDFTWRVFRGGPGGAQVGPTKTTRAAFQAFGAGLHGVSYGRDEVPLVAGETYYVELTSSPGFNPYVTADTADEYAGGAPYQDGAIRSGFELAMTVVVWTDPVEPPPPPPCDGDFANGSFEAALDAWQRYGDARNRTIDSSGGGWFAGIVAADGTRFHGNEINGCCLSGGLYQRFCVTPGHRYRASVASNVYWISGIANDASSRIGLATDGAVDPTSAVVWSARHTQPREATEGWRTIAVEARAVSDSMTVFLDFRQLAATGNMWRINCFDRVEIDDLDAEAPVTFRRGDCDRSGVPDISDGITLLNHLFLGAPAPSCADACDANDDGATDLSDASYLLGFLFLGGTPPPAPFPQCGEDPSDDALDCASPACGAG